MDEWTYLLKVCRDSWRAVGSPWRVLAAVSGGADSVTLLLGLHALSAEAGFALFAAHVDHGLRPESGQDAAFTARLCEALSVPCQVLPVKVLSSGEMGARQARYDALLSHAAALSADALALAHHRQDQAETMLLHLFRGSGGRGLGGMTEGAWRGLPGGGSVVLWRPLLQMDPQGLRGILISRGQAWREDATNSRTDYLRNYLRHQVLPLVERRIPKAQEAMGRAAVLLAQEADYFDQEAGRFLEKHGRLPLPCPWVDGRALDEIHPALRRHVLRLACPVALDSGQTEALLTLGRQETANLPQGWRALRTELRLHFLPPHAPSPSLGRLTQAPLGDSLGDGIRRQAFPAAVLSGCQLRFHRPGDLIRPLGGPGEKSIQDYWVDKKVDRPFRPYLPLLCRGNRVIWSVGVGPGEEARVSPGQEGVLLTYDGYLPEAVFETIIKPKEK